MSRFSCFRMSGSDSLNCSRMSLVEALFTSWNPQVPEKRHYLSHECVLDDTVASSFAIEHGSDPN